MPNGPTSRRRTDRGPLLQRGRFLPKALHATARISTRLMQEPKEDNKHGAAQRSPPRAMAIRLRDILRVLERLPSPHPWTDPLT